MGNVVAALRRRLGSLSLASKLVLLALPPTACLLASGVVFLGVHRAQRDATADLVDAEVLLGDLESLLRLVIDVETAARGFALTGDDSFLAPGDDARDELVAVAGDVDRALGSVVDPSSSGDVLQSLVSQRTTLADQLAAERRAGAIEDSQLRRWLDAGRAVTDQLRAEVEEQEQAVRSAAAARAADAEEVFRRGVTSVSLGLAVGTLSGLVVTFGAARRMARRLSALTEHANRLHRGEPLRQASTAGDEIGQVDRAFHEAALLLAARQEEAAESHRVAVAASTAKNEFLSRISHELRTPLNSIIGFGELLVADGTGERRDAAGQIVRAGRHLLGLINEVLDLSQIESGRLAVSIEPILVADLVRDVVDLLAPLAADRAIQVRVQAGEPADVHVNADRQRFKQALLNLVSNAVKYNRLAGEVDVGWRVVGEQVRTWVRDTGPGIPADKTGLIFAPFERLGAESTGLEGTGLGLSLSRNLVEAMGGSIGFESIEGNGSTFWVELPYVDGLAIDHVVEGEAEPGTFALSRATSGTVLYIEDNLSNVRLVEALIARRPGVELIVAMQADVGLDLAVHHQPDLVLLDLNLPDRSGEEVLAVLHAEPRTSGIPVVIISADASPGQIRRLVASGAADYLSKPFDLSRFLAVVDAHLGRDADAVAGVVAAPSTRLDERTISDLRQLERQGGRVHELVAVFVSELRRRLDELATGVGEGRTSTELDALLHSLRGSASTFGAPRITELVDRVKDLLDVGDLAAVAEAQAALDAEADSVIRALQQLFPRPG